MSPRFLKQKPVPIVNYIACLLWYTTQNKEKKWLWHYHYKRFSSASRKLICLMLTGKNDWPLTVTLINYLQLSGRLIWTIWASI